MQNNPCFLSWIHNRKEKIGLFCLGALPEHSSALLRNNFFHSYRVSCPKIGQNFVWTDLSWCWFKINMKKGFQIYLKPIICSLLLSAFHCHLMAACLHLCFELQAEETIKCFKFWVEVINKIMYDSALPAKAAVDDKLDIVRVHLRDTLNTLS